MPTWRMDLSNKIELKTGERKKNTNFKASEYYKFYNQLINDEKLLKVLKKKKYKCKFVVHPGHAANSSDFETNDYVEVIDENINYSDLFKKASLLITDYSSTFFDFAYLKKPVIYTQFDKDNFYKNQIYSEGYFKYEKDGFGPVYNEYTKTLDCIIKYIENDCKIEQKYLKRIEKFYKYNDKLNCQRVYEEIKKIK